LVLVTFFIRPLVLVVSSPSTLVARTEFLEYNVSTLRTVSEWLRSSAMVECGRVDDDPPNAMWQIGGADDRTHKGGHNIQHRDR
jgi:hypothetical protein